MKRKIAICTLLAIVFAALSLGALLGRKGAEEERRDQDWKLLVRSKIEAERALAKQMVQDGRKATVAHLLSVVNSPVEQPEDFRAPGTSRNIAIRLLGEFRAREAVVSLTKWLTLKEKHYIVVDGMEEYLRLSPAALALIEIGLPSVPAVMNVLKGQEVRQRDQCVRILVAITGARCAEVLFEQAIALERDFDKKTKLEEAQQRLKDPKLRELIEVYDQFPK